MASERLLARRRERDVIRRRLARAGETISEQHDGRRSRLYGAFARGGGIVTVDARPCQWDWSGAREEERLETCESAWALLHHAERGYVTRPQPCGSRLCPVCWAARAGHAAHTWAPVLEAALAEGYHVWHVVLTQRCEAVYGSALIPSERRRWIGKVPVAGQEVPAVAGESCLASYQRWYTSWRRLVHGRAGAELVGGCGILRGTEWTLRPGRTPGPHTPRWHCHGHLLVIGPPSWDGRAMITRWAALHGYYGWSGSTRGLLPGRAPELVPRRRDRPGPRYRLGGLWAERVHGSGAVLEVLKYAYKPTALTTYATLDAWAAVRGTRTHQVAGGLHGGSRLATDPGQPWGGWLAERPRSEGWGLLQEWSAEHGGWVPCLRRLEAIVGGPTAGEADPVRRYRLRIGPDEVLEEEGRLSAWLPAWRAAALRAEPEIASWAGVAPLPEGELL